MIWSRPMTIRLEELAACGFTGREIADRMRLSRGAIIGKANREGIRLGADEALADRVRRGMAYSAGRAAA